MTKITILGAGITGMAIAATLPKHYDVTVLARNLPGDPESAEWASPWAGAIWLGMAGSNESEQTMQLDALAYWLRLAALHPDSSVKAVEMHDVMDHIKPEEVWYRNKVPGYRIMTKAELPSDASFGVAYQSIILTPALFLPWMRKRLEANGVEFKRASVRSLADLQGMGHDILINASGSGPQNLLDIQDPNMVFVRGQTCLVKSKLNTAWIRRGEHYTYHLPRGDGTAVLGGIKEDGQTEIVVQDKVKRDILRRIHENLPQAFPSPELKGFEVVRDLVGIRPYREGGVRLESEVMDGQQVVHAYGVGGGGYVFSWGLAKAAIDLVNQRQYELPVVSKL